MRSISQCFGQNIRRLRLEQDLTQEEFAKKAGLSISFVQNIEYGKKWVAPKTVALLADALHVAESELFRDCAEPPAEPDPKDILLKVARALGFRLDERSLAKVNAGQASTYLFAELHERMPHDVGLELMERCQRDDWDWDEFRKKLRG